MDLRQLEVFLTLADELHFGHTADRLHLTQPQVSRAVAALERHIGAPLFERTSRRVRLTPLGRRLRAEAEPAYRLLLDALRDARAEARQAGGTLRVGFLLPTGGEALSHLIRAYEARHPGRRLSLSNVPYADLYEPLRGNEIDVLISYLILDRDEQSDLTAGPAIDHTARVLVAAAADPLAAKDSISVEDLAGRRTSALPPRFPRVLFDHFVPPATPSGKPIHRTYDLGDDDYGVMTAAVARGHLVHPSVDAFTSLLTHRHDLKLIPIRDLPAVPIGPIWVTARENARIRALADVAANLPPVKPGGPDA
ncbi:MULTISPECIES: LysR family transcriptional regulator [Actinomadura]|uniref:DNA-binding transcriptional regulator, LysR family n=1 Tax=Actinomadura madurae TaxID=1993 RepID=A0A1I5JPI1_9ACTN|nr:LysR family transcriptional regulator [Actinomadura madurae]SFO74423.1 DNA-binding transcriptional regulator, LysR family [Actinomadura madurae]SPT64185.1 HTH-type transcriptional regulator tdfR [Actinomadura madurae]